MWQQLFAQFGLVAIVFTSPGIGSPIADVNPVVTRAPNILLIYIDDLGWRDTGFMGSDFYDTPNLDRLASASLVFTNAYSAAANCAPARACLLSGQYTPRHQVFNVGTRPRGKSIHRRLRHIPGTDTLDPQIRTWAHQLQSVGYNTATIGKWHLSKDPLPYGFDVNIGGTHSGVPPNGYYPPHRNAPHLKTNDPDEYLTDRLTDEAIQYIQAHRDQPWLVYLTHFAVHTPLDAKRKLVQKYENKPPGELHDHVAMATMIEAVDQGVGRVLETLRELELEDNTIVIFYSDNGGYGPATDMDPLKGYKGTYYEGGIRVPFFVHWPGKVKPGKSAEPITGVDLFPTLCSIGKAPLPEQPIDGVDLIPLLNGEVENLNKNGIPRPLFWHFPAYLQSYPGFTDEQLDPLFRSRPVSVIRHGNWKLIENFESGSLELYDLENDIGEMQNLSEGKPEVTDRLWKTLRDWRTRINAPVPVEPNPEFDPKAESIAIERTRKKSRSGKQ